MKRHHAVAVGVAAVLGLAVWLWPRQAQTPESPLPATDDPMMNPDAPQGTDRPSADTLVGDAGLAADGAVSGSLRDALRDGPVPSAGTEQRDRGGVEAGGGFGGEQKKD